MADDMTDEQTRNMVNKDLKNRIVQFLRSEGYSTASPVLSADRISISTEDMDRLIKRATESRH